MIELVIPILMLVFFLALPLYFAVMATKKNDEAQEIINRLKGKPDFNYRGWDQL